MKKNKGEFKESSEISIKRLYPSVCNKNSEPCLHNNDAIYFEDNKKLRKCNHIYIPKKLSSEFVVVMAHAEGQEQVGGSLLSQIPTLATQAWEAYTQQFKSICNQMFSTSNQCEERAVNIAVAVLLFLFVFGICFLICCKCCCKKKADEDSNVDYNQFFMGPDGQMYPQMYQGQMMQPQMFPAGMMYPQMYPQIYPQMYPQMYQAGIQ